MPQIVQTPDILREALTISSGTIASLTGLTTYGAIEALQNLFVRRVQHYLDTKRVEPWETWHSAWDHFQREYIDANHPAWVEIKAVEKNVIRRIA